MTLFYASNGSTVELLANRLHVNGATLGELSVEALREFFQAEQDKRNGVWRESPDSKCAVRDVTEILRGENRWVQVYLEDSGRTVTFWENAIYKEDEAWLAATAWFNAHPPRKPWHDAKQGEVWLLDIKGRKESTPAVFNRFGRFTSDDNVFHVKSGVILGATKIYPKD